LYLILKLKVATLNVEISHLFHTVLFSNFSVTKNTIISELNGIRISESDLLGGPTFNLSALVVQLELNIESSFVAKTLCLCNSAW